MAKIMLSVMPFAGHVSQASGVVAELISRGHTVSVYTGSRFTERFTALGARVNPWTVAPDFDERRIGATFPGAGRPGPRGLIATLDLLFIRSAVGQARDLGLLWEKEPWDLLVGDVMSLGAALAAEKLGVPWATLSVIPLISPSVDLPPSGAGLQPGFGGFGALRDGTLRWIAPLLTRRLLRAHRQVRSTLGLPAPDLPFTAALYSPWLVLATGSAELEFPRSDLPAPVHFVGLLSPSPASIYPQPAWWPDVLASGVPTVLVTQGTLNVDPTQLIRPALEALSGEPVLVVATTGRPSVPAGEPEPSAHPETAELPAPTVLPFPVPANARVAAMVPFDELLPLTDVMVTNGGWGGVLEALARGIPIIVAGSDVDKPEVAARVGWSRAGINLATGRPTVRAVRDAYRQVASKPAFAERARDVAAGLAALGGTARAADLVETLLQTGVPVLRADSNPWKPAA
jgi:UDP:flavonoid glycosyltransferase YjiC (YdhE family)